LALADRLDLEPGGHESGSLEVPPEAFEGYLFARALLLQGGAGLEQAQETLEQTLELVPDWPPALAAYAYSLLLQTAAGADRDGSALAAARKILERARLLDPDLPQAWLYTSLMAHRFDWDWAAADDAARKALALATGDASVLSAASTAEFSLGKFDEGVEHLRKAIVLDPLVLSHRLKYGLMLEFDGQRQSAIDAYRDLMALDPAFPGVHAYLGRTLVIAGRAEAARRHMEIETSDFWRLYGTCLVLFALNRNAEAGLEMARLIREFGGEAAIQIAELYAYDGQLDRAFDWLEKAVEQRDPGVANLVGNPLLENLRNDPRWRDLLDMLRLPAE
jgi:tetratricopeptide (TPR) repeat protein